MKLFEMRGVEALRDRRQDRPASARLQEVVDALPKWTAKQPSDFGWPRSTWTVELLAMHAGHELGVGVSRSHMSRLLEQANCRRVRPQPTVALAPADKDARVAALHAELRALPPQDVVLYSDEVDIHFNPKVGYDWAPAGTRKTLVTPGQNQKWYMAGAFDPAEHLLLCRGGPSKNSDLFIDLVRHVAERYSEAGTVHLIIDNYIIHRSKKSQKAVADLGGKVVLHFLPPYSPEHNLIERVWWNLHACVTRNHRCTDMNELCAQVETFCQTYPVHQGRAGALIRRAA